MLSAALAPLGRGGLPWAAVPGGLAALIAGWGILRLDGHPLSSLGFPARFRGPDGVLAGLGLGLAFGVLVAAVAVGLIAGVGGVRWSGDVGSAGGWLSVGAAALWLFAIPAAAEEALLRGYPLLELRSAFGAGPAVVGTSVVFALLHLGNPGIGGIALVNIGAAGVFLGALAVRTGGLWWPTGAHLGWNWAHAFLADLPVSGLELVDAPLVDARTAGPAWLSGGSFGPEGSVLATAAVTAAAVWTWRTSRFRGADGDRYNEGVGS